MIITLYKSCILNNKYNEVIYQPDIERYLANLSQETIAIDNVYLKETMELPIDFASFTTLPSYNMIDFNYCKIVDGTALSPVMTRYYFIQSVDYVNDEAILSLELDVWSTYSGEMTIRNGHINHYLNWKRGSAESIFNRYTQSELYNIPVPYATNSPITITIDDGITPATKSLGVCVFVQLYNTSTYDQATSRKTGFMILRDITDINNNTPFFSTNIISLCENIQKLAIKSQDRKLTTTYGGTTSFYELVKAYILPKKIIEKLLTNIGTSTQVWIGDDGEHSPSYITGTDADTTSEISISIVNNFNLIGYGTLNHIIPLKPNGQTISGKLTISRTNEDLCLTLNIGEQIVEITDDFEYTMPFNVETADAVQQNKIARELKNRQIGINEAMGVVQSATDITLGAATAAFGLGSGNMVAATGGITQSVLAPVKLAKTIADNELLRWSNNQSMYQTTTSLQVKTTLPLVKRFSICILSISPVNSGQVNKLINKCGYITDLYVNDNFAIEHSGTATEQVVKFTYVWLTGNFSNAINESLTNILTSGIKIYHYPAPENP